MSAFDKACDEIVAVVKRLKLPSSVVLTIEDGSAPAAPAPIMKCALERTVPVIKTQDERFVLGVVLEPLKEMGETDTQNDTYSATEVEKAAHLFMQDYANTGVQHKELANDRVKILETWIQRSDATIEGTPVVKGTWLMAMRIQDDDLWEKVKEGKITGFSIGGVASRAPLET